VTPLYSTAAIKVIEDALAPTVSFPLMLAAAEAAVAPVIALQQQCSDARRPVRIYAGVGHNGSDAIVLANLLYERGLVIELLVAPQARPRPAWVAQRLHDMSPQLAYCGDAIDLSASLPAVIVDGLFGIGLRRAPEGWEARAIAHINHQRQAGVPVLAIDVPSGLNADCGDAPGAVVWANATITFIAQKPGLYTGHGPAVTGTIILADLVRLPAHRSAPDPVAALFDSTDAANQLQRLRRSMLAHKGTQGTVLLIGGDEGMLGAVILAGRATLQIGAGKTHVRSLAPAPPVDAVFPELMLATLASVDSAPEADCVVIGPGLGTSTRAVEAVIAACARPCPLILDADALNLMATNTAVAAAIRARSTTTVLTPHPLEAARLLQADVRSVQQDRRIAAETLAQRYACVIVLKGPGTVVAAPGWLTRIVQTGNPALATAGAGDVLTGLISGLIARQARMPVKAWAEETPAPVAELVCAAVWLHGAAADRHIQQSGGYEGLTASGIAPLAAQVLNKIMANDERPSRTGR
jgi:ADP-dependent NAD(P)H-hydrate dehydratase / NAD(P)H-hydrate epimerase